VDRYEDRLHIAEYERPHERTPAEHGDWLDLMKRTAAEVLDLHPRAVFLKRREAPGAASEYELRGSGGSELQVQEGGLTFQVNLSDYLDTGLFLDHRITRDMVRAAARGTRFLNLFAYTGAFSVYAAAGGSRTTTSVDLSNTYLNWTRTNLEANQLAGPTNRLIQSDVLEFLCKHPSGAQYDLAVVDPPTYSNSKRTRQDWDVQRDHVVLLQRLVRLMSPGATIFFSSNFRRFKLGQFNVPGLVIHEISRQTVPADFRNRRIHRCWRIECPTPQSIEREKAARQAAELEAAKRSAAESDPLSARTAQSDSPNPHAAPSETAGQSLTTGPRTESSGY
jgi:23S rRNA G2069 N7-methylase RlmK/C1962 C5-methylase RlmI